jgi:hypothetical protein
MPRSGPPLTRLQKARPALLASTLLGVVLTVAGLLAGMTQIFMLGLFAALACGFVWQVTRPTPPAR